MSRAIRCSLRGALTSALTLAPTLLAGCFTPSGSASTSSDSDASTGTTPTATTLGTSATSETSDATQGSTDATVTVETTASTEPSTGATDTDTTTTGVPEFCGDGVIQFGEACDDGPDNGDTRPCRSDCVLAVCGDALTCATCTPAETCDDGNAIDDDACDLACQPTTCGDGILDAGEECDDLDPSPGDGCSARCLLEHQRIFLSSIKLDGDFNGLEAADKLCAGLAAPHFNPRRKFVAFMSDTNNPAASRIGVSSFPYRTPTGVQVAGSTQGLLDGMIAAPILETEDGVAQAFSPLCDGVSTVWTATSATGQTIPLSCGDWNTSEGQGLAGNFALVDAGWTQLCPVNCSEALRIYCVEKVL